MKDKACIVSLTSWAPRFQNLPTVIDTIFSQTVRPELVVLNLADDEVVPQYLQEYIDLHGIEVHRMPNTKVFKKLVPTLREYPEACVISIDDDFLYPSRMVEDFMQVHKKYPNNPISGNSVVLFGMQCHCGAASLTKASYFGNYLSSIDDDLMAECKSDDMVYTFLCNKAGHPYIRTRDSYFTNMESYGTVETYSRSTKAANKAIKSTYDYLVKRFGKIDSSFCNYLGDDYLRTIVRDVEIKTVPSLKQLIRERIHLKKI